ncbi:MAG: hypothetical protein PHC97_02695 [Patescibacteria group bacterium]|nr:hypothetical protein [Patescibacteria group bacterium]
MKLSKLQKYILLHSFEAKNKLDRKGLLHFYNNYKDKPSQEIMVSSLTNSIERLIDKGILVGFGEMTKKKNYIQKIKLTAEGRKIGKKIIGEQKSLPLK